MGNALVIYDRAITGINAQANTTTNIRLHQQTYYTTRQHNAPRCSSAPLNKHTTPYDNILQHTAADNMLQHTATLPYSTNILHHTATFCSTLQEGTRQQKHCTTQRHTAPHCSNAQLNKRTIPHDNILQHTATHCLYMICENAVATMHHWIKVPIFVVKYSK